MKNPLLFQNKLYILKKLDGRDYLMPTGQLLADFKTPVRLNETGLWIWKLLNVPMDGQSVCRAACEYFHAETEEERAELCRDVGAFLEAMVQNGILIGRNTSGLADGWDKSTPARYVSIGGITLEIRTPTQYWPKELTAFETARPSAIHQKIAITSHQAPITENGAVIIRSSELVVMETENKFILFFPQVKGLREVHMSRTGRQAVYYLDRDAALEGNIREQFFAAMRVPFLYLGRSAGILGIHGASILYRNRLWIFSAPSGTGKSYHTFLWNRLFGTPVINGDTNLLAPDRSSDRVLVPGMPWCGGSGIASGETYTLGGIILLKQSRENTVTELTPGQKQLGVFQRLITPAWDQRIFSRNFSMVGDIVGRVPVCSYGCNMEKEAAYIIKSRIDQYF